MRKLWLFGLVASSLLIFAACGENTAPQTDDNETAKPVAAVPAADIVESDCELKMGWDPWEPYQYLTPENEVKGLEVDLIGAIAKEAGCTITFEQDNWMNLLVGIRSGTIDLLGGATVTESRAEFAYFSDGYRHESFVLYVRDSEDEKYGTKSLKELLEDGFRLGVTQDYIYSDEVNALQDDENLVSNFISVPITEVNYYNLTQNNIDGFLEDPFVAAFTIQRKGLQGQIVALPTEIESGDVSIIFSKESVKPETVQAFNTALAKLRETGEYDNILAKYRR